MAHRMSLNLTKVVVIAIFASALIGFNLNSNQQRSANERILTSESQSIITFLDYLLYLISSIANTLKIIFQLTALLFIITDLVNFWNLASIYIFLPIEIPKFAKQILQNVWTQFNQPILSFFNISFDTITFKQKSTNYPPQEDYMGALELDVSEIAFEPIFLLLITGIELILLTIVLRWIKRSFRKLRDHVSRGIKLEDVYMKTLPSQKKDQHNPREQNFFDILLKKNKVSPLNGLSSVDKSQKPKKNPQNDLQENQESMKNIFDHEIQSVATEYIKMPTLKEKQKNLDSKISQKIQPSLNLQLKFMFLVHKIAQNKLINSKIKVKNSKHWSQTITIDQFQILSALIISFMPTMFLPLYDTTKNMNYGTLLEKANDLIYILIISVLFIYPFIYLTAKLNSSRKRRILKKKKCLRKKQVKANDVVNKIGETKIKLERSRNLTSINLKEEVFQTFYMFFMNITIPVTVGITSNPVIFLSVNLMVHLLLVTSSITFYRKKSCQGKIRKYNKIIQQLTFLIYHLCYCFVHVFNQMKESLVQSKSIQSDTIKKIEQVIGIMIVGVFALGGLHEMLEFLLKIWLTFFKLIYMLLHVICGGYDIKELEQEIKKYSKAIQAPKIEEKQKDFKRSKNKRTIVFREQKASTPHNTNRSLSQLGIDFEIQIVKNEIILNKIKMEELKEREIIYELNDPQNTMNYKISETLMESKKIVEYKDDSMSFGFALDKTKNLSKKIKSLYKRSDDQLIVRNNYK